ncbi:MAG TPA: DUF2975 domain-containing protein [Rhizomicrobium sp.]|jgi:hypothetical protein|nr:DUF2975 domain-containing protein [Rhizomicrobium sp.]
MKVSERLIRGSRVMAWLSLIGAVVYVAADCLVFLAPGISRELGAIELHHTGMDVTQAIPFVYRAAALAVDLIPASLMVWALLELHRLFLRYAAGDVFTAAALKSLNRVAALMFWYVLVGFVAQAPISALLSWSKSTGHREISLGFTSHDVSFLFMAGVVLVIARVMAEARRVADENESFV